MSEPYKTLTYDEKYFHITSMLDSGVLGSGIIVFPVSGLLPSGEANFYDLEQNLIDRKIYGHNNLVIDFKQGSEPLTYDEIYRPYFAPVIGVSGLKEYASGDVSITYIYNGPDPSGGTGEIDKLPYNVSFDPNNFLIRNSG